MSKHERENKENKKKESAIVTKESICATCAVFSFLAFLILCTRSLIFGTFGEAIHIFLTGLFGYMAYPFVLGAFYLSVMGLIGKRLVKNRKLGVCIFFTLFFISLIVHAAVTYAWSKEGYLTKCFLAGEKFPKATPCGLFGGLIVYAFSSLLTEIGGLIAFSVFTLALAYCCTMAWKGTSKEKKSVEKEIAIAQEEEPQNKGQAPTYVPVVKQRPGVSLDDRANAPSTQAPSQGFSPFGVPSGNERAQATSTAYDTREMLFGGTAAENYKKNLLFDPTARVNQPRPMPQQPTLQSSYTPSYTSDFENSVNSAGEQPRPAKIVDDRSYTPYSVENRVENTPPSMPTPPPRVVEPETTPPPRVEAPSYTPIENTFRREEVVEEFRTPVQPVEEKKEEPSKEEPYRRHNYMDLFSTENPNVFGNEEENARFGRAFADRALERSRDTSEEEIVEERGGRDGLSLLDEEEEDPYTLRSDFETPTERGREVKEESTRGRAFEEESRSREFARETPIAPVAPAQPEPPKPEPPKPRIIRPYVRPRLDDFDCRDIEPTMNEEEVQQTKDNILATLEEFKISGASIASVTFGPTVTRYNVAIPRNIPPRKVVALNEPIAISLMSSGVNIYPNYEDGVVSIEVPNKERQFVQLGCMLSGDTFVNAKPSSLMFAMGKDVANRKVYGDVCKMVHLLVAGSTKSGKSVFLGSLIVSLIYKYSPEELRLILIDPKKTEFVLYNNLPHLMINEIITEPGKAVQSLNWAIGEMNRRYSLFEKMSRAGTYVVNLDQYNAQLEKAERLPKIVIIIDELADLMLAAKKEIEDRIQNLTQKARAAGIHLIVATQRPSTDVITGVIKSNLTTRIAFLVATDVDSRVILDQSGAQKLLGMGDLLYTMPGVNTPIRVQSAFTSPEESQRIVNYIKSNNEAYYDEEATAYINSRGGNGGDPFEGGNGGGGDGGVDPMFIDALRYVIQSNSASISMIQRKCSAGYNRAGKIIEWMEDMGYISPFDGAKARKVLITKEEFESKYGPL